MKIYLVVFEWSTEDDSDVDIEAFDSYEKATMRFQERINDEKTDMSWVHTLSMKTVTFLTDTISMNVNPIRA